MTLQELARANGMSLEEFFGVCWKWKTGHRFPPTATIREDIRLLATHGTVPLYVSHYLAQFNTCQLPN